MPQQSDYLVLGRIGAPYGVQGYNHVQSYCDPAENILMYPKWMLRKNETSSWKSYTLEKGRLHGQHVVAKFEGISDRDAAQLVTGSEIAIEREILDVLPEGEYYWSDLEGLNVETLLGVHLGNIMYLYNIAGHTNMVVKDKDSQSERHIPFIELDFVKEISLGSKKVVVDWDPDL